MPEFDEYDVISCRLCGRFVFPLPGWAEYIQPYHLMCAVWEPQHRFFDGPLHFDCLRSAGFRREFVEEFSEIALTHGQEIAVEVAGEVHVMQRSGLSFTQQVYRGQQCAVHRNSRADTWLVLEHDGPWYVLDSADLRAISEGKPVRSGKYADRTVIPEACEEIARHASLPELLDRAGVTDVYEGALLGADIAYEVHGFHPPKRILQFLVDNVLPIPQEAYDFLRDYARTYEPIDYDRLEEGE